MRISTYKRHLDDSLNEDNWSRSYYSIGDHSSFGLSNSARAGLWITLWVLLSILISGIISCILFAYCSQEVEADPLSDNDETPVHKKEVEVPLSTTIYKKLKRRIKKSLDKHLKRLTRKRFKPDPNQGSSKKL